MILVANFPLKKLSALEFLF